MPETKAAILKKKIEDIIYNLDVQTNSDNVYMGNTGKKLTEFFRSYPTADEMTAAINQALMDFIGDAPEALDTWIELVRWIQEHEDLYEALILELGNKVDAVEGKGLSTNDFTDELLKKLTSLYNYDDLELRNKINSNSEKIIDLMDADVEIMDIIDVHTGKITNLTETSVELQNLTNANSGKIINLMNTNDELWNKVNSNSDKISGHNERISILESIQIINNLLATTSGKGALDAHQGYILDGKITSLETAAGLAIAAAQAVALQAKEAAENAQNAAAGNLPAAGNAVTASRWFAKMLLSLTGDVLGSGNFDGSTTTNIILMLANSGVSAGTYKSVTVDAKGRVTAGTNPTTLAGFGIIDAYTAVQVDNKVLVVNAKISEVETIARGASRAIVFDTLVALNAWLAISSNTSQLRIGDNLFIRELGVSDFWWDGTQKQPLETEKVDLSNIYTKAEIATLLLTKEPLISVGTSSQYWNGTKAWTDFATSTRAAILTGLSLTTTTAVAAADSILAAIGKLQAQISAASGVTAGSFGEVANKTLAYSGAFIVLQATVDARGRVTALNARTMTMPTAPTTITGTAGNITGIAAVANGGTGATTAAAARANLGALGVSDIIKSAVTVKISSGIIAAATGVSIGLTGVTKRGTKFTVGTSSISVSGVEHIEVSGIFLFTDTAPGTTKEITIAFMTGTVETHSIVMPVNAIVPPVTLDTSTVDTIKIYTNAAWSGVTMGTDNVLTIKEL